MAMACFDVFDTVLTRTVGSPASVFLLLGRRLAQQVAIPCTPEAFARARIAAEQRVRNNVGAARYTLREIYRELGAALQLDEPTWEALLRQEYALEAKLARVVPEGRAGVEQARTRGDHVVFVSDMYLPSCFIRKQLERHGLWRDGDACYVSCELGASKVNGLFRAVLTKEQIRPEAVTHWGNHSQVDGRAARQAGLKTEVHDAANANRFEDILNAHMWETEGLSAALAGASRLARLEVPASSAREVSIRDVAASVVAPVLVGYALWILQRAQQLGLSRLYFISRDGQILLGIARRLASRLHSRCELRYLYGSRQILRLAAMTVLDDRGLSQVLSGGTWVRSVRELCWRLQLTPLDVREPLRTAGLAERDWSRLLTLQEWTALRRLVLEDADVRNLILTRAEEQRAMVRQYLEQEGLLDGTPVGVVDVGFNGSTQQALSQISQTKLTAFSLGLHTGTLESWWGLQETFLFDRRLRSGNQPELMSRLWALFDSFCRADHSHVTGYRREQGRVVPVLSAEGIHPLVMWGLPLVHETIRSFVDYLVLDDTLVNPRADVRGALAELLQAFGFSPTRHEVLGWGLFPFEYHGYKTVWRPLAEPYGLKDVLWVFLTGKVPEHRRPPWHEGSLTLTAGPIRWALNGAVRLGVFRKSLGLALEEASRFLFIRCHGRGL